MIAIRRASCADAEAFAAIYAPEVLHHTASFETDPPDADVMAGRIGRMLDAGWPVLVAEADGAVVGYAYATQFRDRAAYAHSCESSVYVATRARRSGAARGLMEALFDAARAVGFRQMIAVIGDSGNTASIGLHSACGFVESGRLRDVGRKFGRWLDVVYMQKSLI